MSNHNTNPPIQIHPVLPPSPPAKSEPKSRNTPPSPTPTITLPFLLDILESHTTVHLNTFPPKSFFTFLHDEGTSTTYLHIAHQKPRKQSITPTKIYASISHGSWLTYHYACGRSLRLQDFKNVTFVPDFPFVFSSASAYAHTETGVDKGDKVQKVAKKTKNADGKESKKMAKVKQNDHAEQIVDPWDEGLKALVLFVFLWCGESDGFEDFGKTSGMKALVNVLGRIPEDGDKIEYGSGERRQEKELIVGQETITGKDSTVSGGGTNEEKDRVTGKASGANGDSMNDGKKRGCGDMIDGMGARNGNEPACKKARIC